MSGEVWIAVFVLGITGLLIALNALFVFHEFAFVMLKPFHIRRLSVSDSWLTRTIVATARKLDHYIAVDQLGITATSLGVGWVGQPFLTRLIRGPFEDLQLLSGVVTAASFVVAFTLLTMLQMVFGELIPKTIALRYPERVATLVSVPVEAVAWVLHPLVALLNGLGNLAVRAIGITPRAEGHHQSLPAEELEAVIAGSSMAGQVRTDPLVMRRTLHFSDLEAQDIIVPRQDVVTLDLSLSIDAVLGIVKRNHFTRYPVVSGSADNVVGLLNVKNLFQTDENHQPVLVSAWHDAIRPIPVLPEVASIEQVLQRLTDEQEQMMLLVDEFGGTSGILTIADIATEATGSSRDIVPLQSGSFLINGESAVSTVESVVGLPLESGRHGYETIAGLIMSVLGRIPSPGDEVVLSGNRLRVHRMKGHRITRVLLIPSPATRPSAE